MRLLCCRGRTRTGDLSQYAGRIQQVSLVDHLIPCYGQADVRAFTSLSYLTHVDFLP